MTRDNFPDCLKITLAHEGGWADHPKDPGGATMQGVTLATYRRHRPGATKDDLRVISRTEVAHIYRVGYWDKVRGDDLPAGVDLATFDAGVNSGPARGARWLQKAVGVPADGAVGPVTVGAAKGRDAVTTVKKLCAARLGFVRGLRTWTTFGRGWSRRIADIEARGVKMAMLDEGFGPVVINRVLREEGAAAAKSASNKDKAAASTGGGGAVVAGGDAASNGDVNLILVAVVLVVVGLAIVAIKSRSKIHRDRAAAYEAAAISA